MDILEKDIAMWIRAEDGSLHNIDHIHTLEVNIEPGGFHVVKARFAHANGATAELTRHGARSQARRALEAIAEAIPKQGEHEGFLDLAALIPNVGAAAVKERLGSEAL